MPVLPVRPLRSVFVLAMFVLPLALAADDPVALVKDGRKLNAAGKQDEALALYEKALAIDPKSFDAHLAAGIALDLKGEYARAREHLQSALEAAPDEARPQALSAMAVSYAFEARPADAARYYQQLFDLQSEGKRLDEAAATANALARVYLESGDLADATRWYETGYETARKIANMPQDQVDLWDLRHEHALARLASRQGRPDEARRHLDAARAIVDKGGPNEEERPVYQYLAGYVALYAKDYDGAIAALQQADQRDPFILSLLARAWEGKGDTARAREYYGQVMQSNAHNIQNAFARPLARKKLAGNATP